MNMKPFLLFISASLILVLSACGGAFNKSSAAGTTYPGHLQGQIFDARTGAPIGGGDLQIIFLQGSSKRGPDSLEREITNPLAGQYAFGNIPVERVAALNKFKLVVVKPGYQLFESEFDYAAELGGNNGGTDKLPTYYSKIGNVYLYPIGAVPAPITVNLTDTYGNAVAGATVQLRQDVAANGANGNNRSTNILTATIGLLPTLSTTVSDAEGKATFAATTLALGASYTPVALALTKNGLNLNTTAGTAITVGTNPQAQVLLMANATYGALAVTARSNSAVAPLTSGVLNIVFNQAITVDSATAYTAVVAATTGGPITATVVGVVTGASLVLTPTFSPAINTATMTGVTIAYSVTTNTAATNAAQTYLTTTGVNATGDFRTAVAAGPAIKVTN